MPEKADTALQNAEAQLAKLASDIIYMEQSIRDKKEEAERVKAFIRAWHDFAGIPVEERNVPLQKTAFGKNPKKEEVAAVARDIILKRGKPMARRELFDALEAHGVHLYGKDPEMVLSTMLWRMSDVIIRLIPHGYWVTSHPYEPARYQPGDKNRSFQPRQPG